MAAISEHKPRPEDLGDTDRARPIGRRLFVAVVRRDAHH
jgi:hypothetical protein